MFIGVYKCRELDQWIPYSWIYWIRSMLLSLFVCLFLLSFIHSFFLLLSFDVLCHVCLRCVSIYLHTLVIDSLTSIVYRLHKTFIFFLDKVKLFGVRLVVWTHNRIKCELPCSFVFMTDYIMPYKWFFLHRYKYRCILYVDSHAEKQCWVFYRVMPYDVSDTHAESI